MELLPLAFSAGWTSGINAYATVFVLGLLGRFAGVEAIPTGLERTDVLIVCGVLMVIEFAADKIAYVDSIWDTISTFVRPVAGAVIGALLAGSNGDLVTIALASVGGVTALLSHLAKASLRLAINTSPEPVTNIGASLVGDVSVAGVAALAALHPVPAAIMAGVLLVVSVTLALVVMKRVRRAGAPSAAGSTRTPASRPARWHDRAPPDRPVVVIGGGLAGMAAAARLAKAGARGGAVRAGPRARWPLGALRAGLDRGPGRRRARRCSASRPRGATCSARAVARWRPSWPGAGLALVAGRSRWSWPSPTAPSCASDRPGRAVRGAEPPRTGRPVAERWRDLLDRLDDVWQALRPLGLEAELPKRRLTRPRSQAAVTARRWPIWPRTSVIRTWRP